MAAWRSKCLSMTENTSAIYLNFISYLQNIGLQFKMFLTLTRWAKLVTTNMKQFLHCTMNNHLNFLMFKTHFLFFEMNYHIWQQFSKELLNFFSKFIVNKYNLQLSLEVSFMESWNFLIKFTFIKIRRGEVKSTTFTFKKVD